MNLAYTMQHFHDWFTQQWVIVMGKKINPQEHLWLMGPFGEINGIGEQFIEQLAKREQLIIKRNCTNTGLLKTIHSLNLNTTAQNRLSEKVIHFYENTSDYSLQFETNWNVFFKPFGYAVNRLFSQRINQLNISTKSNTDETLKSEIIQLIDSKNNEVKYTVWLRKTITTEKIVYSGIYTTCKLPSGSTCIKAVFPLPKGNATIIMKPSVGHMNELILDASGSKFSDAGFYFLLNDAKNNFWTHFISSFTNKLIVYEKNNTLFAQQLIKLW